MLEKIQLLFHLIVYVTFVMLAYRTLTALRWEQWLRTQRQAHLMVLLLLLSLALGGIVTQSILWIVGLLQRLVLG